MNYAATAFAEPFYFDWSQAEYSPLANELVKKVEDQGCVTIGKGNLFCLASYLFDLQAIEADEDSQLYNLDPHQAPYWLFINEAYLPILGPEDLSIYSSFELRKMLNGGLE